LNADELSAIQQGIYLCTNCDRCTVVCPSGIRLKDLWVDAREAIIQKGCPEPALLSPYSFYRGLNREKFTDNYEKPIQTIQNALAEKFKTIDTANEPIVIGEKGSDKWARLTDPSTYTFCFGCMNCTNVCPVVDSYDDPERKEGLLPHQIMNCLGLGLLEMASGASMLWDCTTCYQCQEHCPQQVKVTDVLFQLKQLAAKNLEKTAC
jgi:heterodisulfide reductase subunit C